VSCVRFADPLVIGPLHHRLGKKAYAEFCKANGGDKGTRGLDYAGNTDRHKKAEYGMVIESAFLDSLGLDPMPRVNPDGRDDEPDAIKGGKAYDVKGTGTGFPFVARAKARRHRDWTFVIYSFDGKLLAVATGEEFVQHGELCTKADLRYNARSNVKLPIGYGVG
jgi:hypothetical protein